MLIFELIASARASLKIIVRAVSCALLKFLDFQLCVSLSLISYYMSQLDLIYLMDSDAILILILSHLPCGELCYKSP